MIVIDINNLTIGFGAREIFKDISLTVHKGECIGLTGANGAGKTSLMRAILGELTPSNGTVSLARGYTAGYLAQQHTIEGAHTVWQEAEGAFDALFATEKKMHELEAQMANVNSEEKLEELGRQYARLTEIFERAEGYAWRSRTAGVLKGLGLAEEYWERSISALSGGERTRLALARMLLNNYDVLLLDEPTNHLDLSAAEWLTGFLARYQGTILLISHDRYMLDRLCGSIAQLENGHLYRYSGNYSQYCIKRAEAVRNQQKLYDEQQLEIERQKEIIKRYRSYNREKSIRAAESREKALERMELVEKPEDKRNMRLHFHCFRTSGREILRIDGLAKSFGEQKLFENVNTKVFSGDRIALLGSNGAGKTTLLKILLGKVNADKGAVTWGVNADKGYYDQHQPASTEDGTMLDMVWQGNRALTQTEVRSALAAMLFSGEEVFKTAAALSGGERARVSLCKLSVSGSNILLLDEPTNHLDMASREILEEALLRYDGTIITVSHDRYFINKLATRLWLIEEGTFEVFEGNYDQYIAAKAQTEEQTPAQPSITKTQSGKLSRLEKQEKENTKMQKKLQKQLESEIENLEQQKAALEELFSGSEIYLDINKLRTAQEDYESIKLKLEEKLEEWLAGS